MYDSSFPRPRDPGDSGDANDPGDSGDPGDPKQAAGPQGPGLRSSLEAIMLVAERFVSDGQEIRLTQAALETLSVVAYRQPVSRARVSAVRGVNCDGVMRTLVLRGLVEEAGADPDTGAILFQTTGYFLERLGLPSLVELPELAPFLPDDLETEEDGHAPAAS